MLIKILVIAVIVLSCKSNNSDKKFSKSTSPDLTIPLSKTDTTGLSWNIDGRDWERLSALKISDRTKYGHEILKKYAFCTCLRKMLPNDSLYRKADNSIGVLVRELLVHPRYVLDSIDKTVVMYVGKGFSASGTLALSCLTFYESPYLDSLVKRFDKYINAKDF